MNPFFTMGAARFEFLRIRRLHRRIATKAVTVLCTVVGGWSCLPAAATAAPPEGSLPEPVAVAVSGSVEVRGAVQVVNDALKTPYAHTETFSLAPNNVNETRLITLPVAKRLVVESVTVRLGVPAGQFGAASLTLGTAVADISVQSQGLFGPESVFIGTHRVRLRINTSETPALGVGVVRSAGIGSAQVRVSVFGYVEDL